MRIKLARFLLRLGELIQSTAVVVMKPDDLVEFSRQSYAKPRDVDSWAEDAVVDSGLSADEKELLAALPATSGELLLLGVGGGREAIPLARMGFRVTGVDYVAAMVERSKENALRRGLTIEGEVQEISRLVTPPGIYDVVWLSRAMYSCVPTRARRVEMVRRIARALKPGGTFLFQFHWDPSATSSKKKIILHRLVAALTLGNQAYEDGDILWGKVEFLHAFSAEETVRAEIEEAGLSVVSFLAGGIPIRRGVICIKKP